MGWFFKSKPDPVVLAVRKIIEDTRTDRYFWYLVDTGYCQGIFQPARSERAGDPMLDIVLIETVNGLRHCYVLEVQGVELAVPGRLLRRLYKEVERNRQRRRKREQISIARQFLGWDEEP